MKYSKIVIDILYKFDTIDYYGLALNDALCKYIFNVMLKENK